MAFSISNMGFYCDKKTSAQTPFENDGTVADSLNARETFGIWLLWKLGKKKRSKQMCYSRQSGLDFSRSVWEIAALRTRVQLLFIYSCSVNVAMFWEGRLPEHILQKKLLKIPQHGYKWLLMYLDETFVCSIDRDTVGGCRFPDRARHYNWTIKKWEQ